MKVVLLLLFFNLSSYSQEQPIKILDIVKVGMDINSFKEAFSGFSILLEPMHLYGVDSETNGVTICKDGEKLLFLWSKYNDDKIYEVVVLSPDVEIDGKIKVGDSFQDFLNIFPDSKLEKNPVNEDSEYAHSEKNNYLVEFLNLEEGSVAEYNDNYSLKKIINFNAKIDRIRLLK